MTTSAKALDTFTISGTVYGNGTPLSGVTVTALENSTQDQTASVVTGTDGAYSLTVPAGTYDLVVKPAAGSGFGQEVVQDIVVTGNVSQDVVLLTEQDTIDVSGTLYGYGGNPVANARVQIYAGPVSVNVPTDADGHYSATVPSGTYTVQFYYGSPLSPHAPAGYYYCYRYNVAFGESTTFDYTLPVARLHGATVGEDGPTVGNTRLDLWGSYGATNTSCYTSYSVTSDAAGAYSALVFPGTVSARVTPPADSPYGAMQTSVAVSADKNHDFVLARESTLSGTITGYGGGVVANAQVHLYASDGTYTSTVADASGAYSVNIPPGTYRMQASYRSPLSPNAPQGYYYCQESNISVTGDKTHNLAMPVIRVSGQITGAPDATPLADTGLNVWESYSANNLSCYTSHQVTTDANGQYALLAFPGSLSYGVYPAAADSGYGPKRGSVTVTGDATHDITLQAAVYLSGTLTGYQGNAVANANVQVWNSGISLSQTTDSNGRYRFALSADTYYFQTSPYYSGSPHVPHGYNYCQKSNMAISADTTLDVAFPVVRVTGLVTDFNGAPVPGTRVSPSGASFSDNGVSCYHSGDSATSTAGGDYSMLLFKGTRQFTIRPPANSGFTAVAIPNVSITGDRRQDVRLQRPDRTPPVIVSGPSVIHLSDTSVSINWVTDEPSDSTVDYGLGGLTGTAHKDELVTTHSVTLFGLDAQSLYTFRVGSTDEAGNGPTQSSTDTFSTIEAPGDITAPTITDGPDVAYVDRTSAIIHWETDEPATSVVRYGLTTSLGTSVEASAGTYLLSHAATLSGLTPGTTYYAEVESTDPDNNGPTISGIINFTTAQAPDTTAPLILTGPTITGTTDTTITVAWTTDEPATSGVSYTDGTTYNLVTDPALVKLHSVTLASLTPSTTYSITVSSRDGAGNGPTLGGPVSGTTQDAPDTTAPVISNIAVAAEQTSAIIEWDTDELATSRVVYSSMGQSADYTVAAVALVTAHSLTLQGLLPGTTYHYQLSSKDASGNQGTSTWLTFTTAAPACERSGANGSWNHCTAECPCGAGQGDCDSDAECGAGLTCVKNVGASYGWNKDVDVCEATCHPSAAGGWQYCSAECPCDEGEGDCDSNDECAPGLSCVRNVGANYGWDGQVDVCEATCHPSTNGGWHYCSEGCRCDAGEGDCDSDAECADGLVCLKNVGRQYGWDRDVDVCGAPMSAGTSSLLPDLDVAAAASRQDEQAMRQ